MLFIGIDLGTSACKLLLVGEDGTIQNEVTKEYPLSFPHPGWAEQRPEEWWDAVVTGVPELLRGFDANDVASIGSGGQMHGLVALDEHDHVIRPAILWNDGRTFKEVDYLNNVVGKDRLSELTANIAFAGFTAPKLLWMRENEPENFEKIAKIMLPKDYLTYKLTGVHACDYSDASGMLLLDVQHKRWSQEMLEICGVSERQMPKLFESFAVVGRLTKEAAQTLGLPETVKVVAGAGDNAAAAVGTGTVGAGGCNLSLGTSGTIFISSDKFGVDPNNALHAFAHADGGYHLMGCMLSAASCNKWLCEEILKTSDFAGEQTDITDEKLDILRRSDFILRDEIAKAGLDRSVWQYFTVFTGIRSVGVMGDQRTYDYAIGVRAVTSTDAMTVEFAELPYDLLRTISNRIIAETPHVNRVMFDITDKPPGTIEWE